METIVYLLFGAGIGVFLFYKANFSPEAKFRQEAQRQAQQKIVCPHCNTTGSVTVRRLQQKQGVSGGKATSALLTGGVSLVAVGLSKKGWVNQLTCSSCSMVWHAA